MKRTLSIIMAIAFFTVAFKGAGDETIYQFTMNDIYGEPVPLSKYKGKVLVVVNVASKCGLTPQYEEIQAFYEEYKDKGVAVLGFPANNFLKQEPGTNEEIESFCKKNYGVTFDMFEKISVKGKEQHPLYEFLTSKELNGVEDSEVKWNFQKYIIGKDGKLVTHLHPRTSIKDVEAIKQIDALLTAKK